MGTDEIIARPRITESKTFAFELQCGHTYITVCYVDDKPFDMFIHKGHSSSCARCVAEGIGKLCSLALRHGISKEVLIQHLEDTDCGFGTWEDGVFTSSCFDAIAKSLGGNYVC